MGRWRTPREPQALTARFGADPVAAAAKAFSEANAAAPGLFELGRYSPETARATGYDCLIPPAP